MKNISRRNFIRASATGAALLPGMTLAQDADAKSAVFRVNDCPIHDGQLRHVGLDSLLHLLSVNGTKFYQTSARGDLNGPGGLIAADD
ncbi:MAG TPA: twin-arginine translocation signal domain-containing protein, partial [Verrucomicrobiae bacterium]|nr:twin-arginine translocation signal domain-containing protein [Verrucomicrobiae bacterium]